MQIEYMDFSIGLNQSKSCPSPTDDVHAWLRATFAPEQLTVFAKGGHLGNLFNPTVQKTILGALANMKGFPDKPLTLPTPQK